MPTRFSAGRVILKTAVLLLILESLLVALPFPKWTVNAFGLFRSKRERFPLSTIPPADNALDVGNLDAMFSSHVISEPKRADEFRVLVLGDSTIWGLQLTAAEVLPGQLGQLGLACGDKQLRFYNLSFPRSSATKDLMILDQAMAYRPDAIIWLVTWYTLMPKTRTDHWLIVQNPEVFRRLGDRFSFIPKDYRAPNLMDQTYNRNRSLFRALRYQLYALVSLATGQDQIPGPPQVLATELSTDETFEGLKPPTLRKQQVSLDQLKAFFELADDVPVLLVNEPILIMQGIPNSDRRYNSYYPKWAYDQYRAYLADAAIQNGWDYQDLWNAFPAEAFADTPLHLKPEAHRKLAELLAPEILRTCR
ncbi:MAG TPA: hypothetical protein VIU38_10010 [Anaerolineales bacterium]